MNGFADRGLDEGSFAPSSGFSVSTFDAFPKTKQTYLTSTKNGTLWTILLMSFCSWLTVTEFWRWMQGTTTHSFSVEKGIAHDLQINMDIVIAMKCADLHVNVQDASGDRVLASEKLRKDGTTFHQWGQGSLAVDKKTGEKTHRDHFTGAAVIRDQFEQYRNQEDVHKYLGEARARRKWPGTPRIRRGDTEDACRIYGSVEGNKVQGDFHITARGHGYQEFSSGHLDHKTFNFSHRINELSFGPYFPEITQPLDHLHVTTPYHFFKYQYYLNIVPTIYTDALHELTHSSPPHIAQQNYAELQRRRAERQKRENHGTWSGGGKGGNTANMAASEPDHPSHGYGGAGKYNPFASSTHTIYTNQYAVTEQSHVVSESNVPGIFMKYDIEPVLHTVAETWGGFLGLFVRCVNVVAGVLVAGGWLVALGEWVGEVGRRRRRGDSVGGLIHGNGNGQGWGREREKMGLD